MKRLCQGVLCASMLVSGCYQMHGRPGGDAGVDSLAAPPPPPRRSDGGPPVDTFGSPDAPSACPLLRADASCLESYAIVAGQPFELPFQYDTCGCCVETSCAVSVDEAARTLRLSTGLCPDPCDCDACNTPRGTCAVPPLFALGQWTVEVNGVVAFPIGVVEVSDPTAVPAPPGCATYAEIDECGGAVPDLTTGPVRDVCVEVGHHPDRDTLRLRSSCWGCGQLDSVCQVVVVPRLTDDLPPGGDITLHSRDYYTACDVDCPAVCIEHVRECDLPPLVDGQFYRVFVDGEVMRTFTAGEPTVPCVMP